MTTRQIGYNPKVNNLAGILDIAQHELLLISDSNVRVESSYLHDNVALINSPGVGLVTSLFRGVGSSGLGGALEGVQLNSFVMGGVATLSGVFGRVCAVGKSMMLTRKTLDRIGGLRRLSRYLAEDQVCGEEIAALNLRVVVNHRPIDNVLGRLGFRQFCSRHLRWARIRRHICPPGYAAEILLNPVGLAAVNLLLFPGLNSALFIGATLAAMTLNALVAERSSSVMRHPAAYIGLELVRGLTMLVLWPVPFFSTTVSWRGNALRVGKRTLLTSHRHHAELPEWDLDLTDWDLDPRPETP